MNDEADELDETDAQPDLPPGLSDRQAKALPIVLQAATIKAGMEAAGLHRTTWHRWMKDPAFRSAFDAARKEARDEAHGDLRHGVRYAVTSLLGLLASKNETVRLQACRTVLELSQRSVEVDELGERLERIEQALTGLVDGGAPEVAP